MTVTCGDVGKDPVGKRHEEVTCVVQRKWSRGVEGEGERAVSVKKPGGIQKAGGFFA